MDLVDAGKINQAENRLSDFVNGADKGSLEMALLFYSYLNDKPDEFLKDHDFSREEIKLGMDRVVDVFGLSGIAKVFLTDF